MRSSCIGSARLTGLNSNAERINSSSYTKFGFIKHSSAGWTPNFDVLLHEACIVRQLRRGFVWNAGLLLLSRATLARICTTIRHRRHKGREVQNHPLRRSPTPQSTAATSASQPPAASTRRPIQPSVGTRLQIQRAITTERSKISPAANSDDNETAAMAAAAVASTSRPFRASPRGALGGASSHAPHHFSARPLQSRRPRLAVAATAGVEEKEEARGGPERFYFNFTGFPFPLGPFLNRRTIRTEVTNRSRRFYLPIATAKNSPFSEGIPLVGCVGRSGGEGQRMAVRAGAGAGLQQCLHQHPHDRRQAQVWRALGARAHRAHQRVHPGTHPASQPHHPPPPRRILFVLYAAHVVSVVQQLLKELDAPVEYIVLPTFAYEHKIFVGPFSRKFPKAQIWVAPRQWSWPINLPLEFFGIFRAKSLKDEDEATPWAAEIKQKVLSSPEVGIAAAQFQHCVVHCRIHTLSLNVIRCFQGSDPMWRWRSTISLHGHCW